MNEKDSAKRQFGTALGAFGGGPGASGPAEAMQMSGFTNLPWPHKPVGKAGQSGKGSIGKHQGGKSRGGRGRTKKTH